MTRIIVGGEPHVIITCPDGSGRIEHEHTGDVFFAHHDQEVVQHTLEALFDYR